MRILKRTAFAATTTMMMLATAASAETSITFSLDFISLGRHAPWYVAVDKGFFAEEGLEISILPSKGTADAIRAVATNTTPIGLIDFPSLVAAGEAAEVVKIVAGAYVEAPYCVWSLNPGGNIDSLAKLQDVPFGSSSASFIPAVWRAILSMNGLDPTKLNVVNIEPAARIPMLVTGDVAGIDQFIMSEPGVKAAAEGKEAVCLFAADMGLDIYSNSIGVNAAFLEANPDAVKGFVRAAMRGWQYTLQNREEATEIMVKAIPALNPDVVRAEIDILERVAVNDDVKAHGYGNILPERVAATVAFIQENAEIAEPRDPASFFVPGYLAEPPILP